MAQSLNNPSYRSDKGKNSSSPVVTDKHLYGLNKARRSGAWYVQQISPAKVHSIYLGTPIILTKIVS